MDLTLPEAIDLFGNNIKSLMYFAYNRNKTNELLCIAKTRVKIAYDEDPGTLVQIGAPLILEYSTYIRNKDDRLFLNHFEKEVNMAESDSISANDIKELLQQIRDLWESLSQDEKNTVWKKAKTILACAAACKIHKYI